MRAENKTFMDLGPVVLPTMYAYSFPSSTAIGRITSLVLVLVLVVYSRDQWEWTKFEVYPPSTLFSKKRSL